MKGIFIRNKGTEAKQAGSSAKTGARVAVSRLWGGTIGGNPPIDGGNEQIGAKKMVIRGIGNLFQKWNLWIKILETNNLPNKYHIIWQILASFLHIQIENGKAILMRVGGLIFRSPGNTVYRST